MQRQVPLSCLPSNPDLIRNGTKPTMQHIHTRTTLDPSFQTISCRILVSSTALASFSFHPHSPISISIVEYVHIIQRRRDVRVTTTTRNTDRNKNVGVGSKRNETKRNQCWPVHVEPFHLRLSFQNEILLSDVFDD